MIRRTVSKLPAIAALLVLAILIPATNAMAAPQHLSHLINVVAKQHMLTQMMSKESLLVALEVDKSRNLDNLKSNQIYFDRVLQGLRYGDINLGVPGTRRPEILEKLDRVEALWPQFENAVHSSVTSGGVSAEQLDTIAAVNLDLLEATDETVTAYQIAAATGGLFSMIDMAVDRSGRQRTLTQRMSKEFLLVAYGHDVQKNRKQLRETIRQFERTLRGMIDGDIELLLLPAPSPEIRGQLRKVERLWDEFHPLLLTAFETDGISPEVIAQVARDNMSLLQEMDAVVELYAAL
jgi:hypothetical protein